MAEPFIDNPCINCDGTGDDGSGFCVSCLGSGKRVDIGRHIFLKKLYDDVMNKLDVIAVQVQALYDDLNP